jgi:hypothetical protein
VFASLLLSFSSVVSVLAVLDWLLSDAQKKRISDVTLLVWNRLDELKRGSFLRVFESKTKRAMLCAGGSIMCVQPIIDHLFWNARNPLVADVLLVLTEVFGLMQGPAVIAVVAVMAASTGIVGYIGLSFLLNDLSFKRLMARSTLMLFVALTPILIAMTVSVPIQISVISFFISVQFAVIWIVIVAPIAFAALASGLLYVAEMLLRRIAENPKGPIIALSAFLSLVLAALKVFD